MDVRSTFAAHRRLRGCITRMGPTNSTGSPCTTLRPVVVTVHSSTWGGLTRPKLRLAAAANGRQKGIRPAAAFLYPEFGREYRPDGTERLGMLADPAPE